MTPPAELLRQAEANVAEYEELLKQARAHVTELEDALAAQQSVARMLRELVETGFTSIKRERSMLSSKMELENARVNKRVKIAATMTGNATKAKRALLEVGLTPQDVADKRKVGRSTVDAWCRGTRSIPRADREWLKAEYGIPFHVWKKQAE